MTEKRLNIDLIEDLFVREELIRLYEENEELKKRNEYLKKRCDEYWKEAGLNNDYFE